MNTRSAASALLTALLATGCATAEKGGPAAPAQAAASAIQPALVVPGAGTTAAEVVRLLGNPTEVKPMTAAAGRAEEWTYRRIVDAQTTQVETPTRGVPEATTGHGIVSPGTAAPGTEFHTVYVTIWQVTTILMFNDKLVTAKQWSEKREGVNN